MDLVLQSKKIILKECLLKYIKIYEEKELMNIKKRNLNMRVLYLERFVYENIIQNHKFNLYESIVKVLSIYKTHLINISFFA